jgi:hypothetical protein
LNCCIREFQLRQNLVVRLGNTWVTDVPGYALLPTVGNNG